METITFYSYKGGVGRTLALANFAQYLAKKDHNVFVMDLDLESPGLHYKLPPSTSNELPDNLGFVSYFYDWDQTGKTPENLEDFVYEYKIESKRGNKSDSKIKVMPASNLKKDSYLSASQNLNWDTIFNQDEGFKVLLNLKYQIQDYLSKLDDSNRENYLLIDARTGVGEVGGFVTTLMSDSVVLLFSNDDENLDGIIKMIKVLSQVPLLDRRKPIKVFPVTVRQQLIDPEYDQNIKDKINKKIATFLKESIDKIDLQSCHILHIDNEVQVSEYLLMEGIKANESSGLYIDYIMLFERLLGNTIDANEVANQCKEVPVSEKMRRARALLNPLEKEHIFSLKHTLEHIEKCQQKNSQIPDIETAQYDFEQLKDWEKKLPEYLKDHGGLQEFWILLPEFLAYPDRDFLKITKNNLIGGAKYIYFLPNYDDINRLEVVANQIINNFNRQQNQNIDIIKKTVEQNLRFVFVENNEFRIFLRYLNYFIANPRTPKKKNDISTSISSDFDTPKGVKLITHPETKKRGYINKVVKRAVHLKPIECEEIVKVVTHFVGDDPELKDFSVI